MRDSLNEIVKKFVENMNLSKKKYKFELDITKGLIALMYTREEKIIDYEKIERAKDIIKDNTGIFSDFRSQNILPGAVKLSLRDNPKELFLNAKKAREIFKEKFKHSRSSANISYFLAENREKFDTTKAVNRGRMVYELHKDNHPFITGDEDILLSILLAVNKEDLKQGVLDSEYYYHKLKKDLKYKQGVQRISNILSLFNLEKDEIIRRIIDLNSSLKLETYKLSENTLFILPLLVILEEDNLKIKKEIIEVYESLEKNKIVGIFKLEKTYGLMFSGILLALDYINSKNSSNSFEEIVINEINNIENIIQDIVLMNTIIVTNSIIINNSSNN